MAADAVSQSSVKQCNTPPTSAAFSSRNIFRVSARAMRVCTITGIPASRAARTCTRKRRSEEHTSELQSRENLVCRLLREKKSPQYCRPEVENVDHNWV